MFQSFAMWPVLVGFARTYAPVIVFPFAFTIGVIGYNLEGWMSDKQTPWKKSIIERRDERKSKDQEDTFEVPKTIFERFKKEDDKKD